TGLLSRKLKAGNPYPVGPIAFMKEHHLSGNIMPSFLWGEYVIWHMSPASKVFIDGRYDTVFPHEVIRDYLVFNYGQPGASQFLTKYPHDFILLSRLDETPCKEMETAAGWKQIYRDDT